MPQLSEYALLFRAVLFFADTSVACVDEQAGEDQSTRHEPLQAALYPEFDSMVGFWKML
jgi:hypothetical protein